MGCGCKKVSVNTKGETKPIEENKISFNYFGLIYFIIGVLLLPLIYPIVVWSMFSDFVFGRKLDLSKTLLTIINKTKKDKEEVIIDSDGVDLDEYELTGIEVLEKENE